MLHAVVVAMREIVAQVRFHKAVDDEPSVLHRSLRTDFWL